MLEHQNLQPLVQLEQYNIALLFVNYLSTLHITAEVVTESANIENIENKQGYTVYCQQNKIAQAQMEFEHFIQNP